MDQPRKEIKENPLFANRKIRHLTSKFYIEYSNSCGPIASSEADNWQMKAKAISGVSLIIAT